MGDKRMNGSWLNPEYILPNKDTTVVLIVRLTTETFDELEHSKTILGVFKKENKTFYDSYGYELDNVKWWTFIPDQPTESEEE